MFVAVLSFVLPAAGAAFADPPSADGGNGAGRTDRCAGPQHDRPASCQSKAEPASGPHATTGNVTGPVANGPRPLVGDAASQPDVVPGEQLAVIDQMIDAIHSRDTEAFIDVFAPDGAFNPRGDFAETSSRDLNEQPVAAVPLVGAWMGIIDAWGLEAGVVACNPLDGPGYMADDSTLVQCEVETRWHTLFMEITEGWGFEFRGTRAALVEFVNRHEYRHCSVSVDQSRA